jgi:hypothetical protein
LLRNEIEEDLVVKLLLLLSVGIEKPVIEILIGFVLPKAYESADIESRVPIRVLPDELSVVGEHLEEDAVKLVPYHINPLHVHEFVCIIILLTDYALDILGQLTEELLRQLQLVHPLLLLVVPHACA